MKYSEIFLSAQGEGKYIGEPSVWVRFFLCNLQCDGFGQTDPTDPSTYDLPYEKINIADITEVEQLPVFEKGCDSSYTWSKKYRHLMRDKTASELADEMIALIPGGRFVEGEKDFHLCITGGEPLLKPNQKNVVALLEEFIDRGNYPKHVTFETNGTRIIGDELKAVFERLQDLGTEIFFSISPKLWHVAGEKPDKAIKPEVVGQYAQISKHGQLKYVVNVDQRSWDEVESNTALFREAGNDYPVWVMGLGGTFEGLTMTEADIADKALTYGYKYSSRVHVHIYGNAIGK